MEAKRIKFDVRFVWFGDKDKDMDSKALYDILNSLISSKHNTRDNYISILGVSRGETEEVKSIEVDPDSFRDSIVEKGV